MAVKKSQLYSSLLERARNRRPGRVVLKVDLADTCDVCGLLVAVRETQKQGRCVGWEDYPQP